MNDLIKHINAIRNIPVQGDAIKYKLICALIDREGSQFEEKTGKWKPFDLTYGRNIYFCTACNNASEVPTSMGEPVYKFCPWCGASMEVE